MDIRTDNAVPCHVSIIMDGNGRWAKARGRERVDGHKEGAESIKACCASALKCGVKYLSFFAFSEENWGRPKEEVSALMSLFLDSLLNQKSVFMDNRIRFRVIGKKDNVSPEILEAIASLEEETSSFDVMTVIIFFNYSGKWDILQAAARYAESAVRSADGHVPVPDRDVFDSLLATSGIPDPDLLIRTSGEQRLSNYLLWQCAYTEFYFTDTFWPDFRESEWLKALDAYSNRERRYGKLTK